MKKYLVIDSWNGGLANGARLDTAGSFRFGQGLNFRDNPDAVTANYALAKDSGDTVVGRVHWIVARDNGDLFCTDDGGKTYKRTAAGVWSNINSPTNSKGQGLEIYADYLYYTQDSQIGRYGLLSGDPSATDNWQTSLDATTSWRPLKAFMNLLAVGNGRYLATYDGATWDADRVTFPDDWYVRDLGIMGEYLVIAVNNAENPAYASRGILFFWDGTSSTYNFFSEVTGGGGIDSIQANQDSVYVFAGGAGNIYLYNGRSTKVKKIPFINNKDTINVSPGADTNYRGNLHFGVTSGTSNSVYRGVYSWGSPGKNYPDVLNFDYPISQGTTQTTDVQVTAVKAIGNDLWVGWQKSGSPNTYGVDKLGTNFQTSVWLETRIAGLDKQSKFTRFKLFFEPLTTGESVDLKYKADQESSWQDIGSASYTTDGAATTKLLNEEFSATDVEFKITLAGTTAVMPTLTKLIVEYEEEGLL